jgi:hypothetical protein
MYAGCGKVWNLWDMEAKAATPAQIINILCLVACHFNGKSTQCNHILPNQPTFSEVREF